MSKPDYEAPILGVRNFSVGTDGTLVSFGGYTWEPGVLHKARCEVRELRRWTYYTGSGLRGHRALEPHKAPALDCTCGFHAFVDYPTAKERADPTNLGAVRCVVEAQGEIELAEYGFRAERMRVVALIMEDKELFVMGTSVSLLGPHEALAKSYGVPLLMPEDVPLWMELRDAVVLAPEVVVPDLSKAFDTYGLKIGWHNVPPLPLAQDVVKTPSLPPGAIHQQYFLTRKKPKMTYRKWRTLMDKLYKGGR